MEMRTIKKNKLRYTSSGCNLLSCKLSMCIMLFMLLLLTILIISSASAEIFLGQPEALYNLGDELRINATLKPVSDTNAPFVLSLVCGNNSIELYRNPFNIKSGNERTVNIEATLTKSLIGNLAGNCYAKAVYAKDSALSQRFEITKEIIVGLELQKFSFEPSEIVNVAGNAVKKNGEKAGGFIELAIKELGINIAGSVSLGNFELNFTIPENAKAGNYALTAKVYEKDNEEVSNDGRGSVGIGIKQVFRSLEIAFDSQTISPGEELTYKVFIYDQSGIEANGDASVVIYENGESVYAKKLVKSGESNKFEANNTHSPGYWKIEASVNELKASKLFQIKEVEGVSFSLINDTLIIYNTGNVPYKKPVEVSIGGVIEVKDVELGVGESKRFRLSAPDGNYDVKVNDGEEEEALGSVYLTGKAVNVKDLSNKLGIDNESVKSILWIAIIAIIAFIAYSYYKKISRKSFFGRASEGSQKYPELKTGVSPISISKESSIIERGEKQEAVIIALRIRNIAEAERNSYARESLDKALETAKDAKASIYSSGEFRIIIFAPALTNSQDNNLAAVKTAQQIADNLNSYNKKFSLNINFGVGVNSGILIAEKMKDRFRFTPVGNTVIAARKLAVHSHGEVLISDALYRKVMGTVRGEKASGISAWKVSKIIDRSRHHGFVKGFMERG